jgi:hypothetical protein
VLTRNVNTILHTGYRVEDVQAFDDWRLDALAALMEKLARDKD